MHPRLPPRAPLTCPCGTPYQPADKGPPALRCPACRERDKRFLLAVKVIEAALADPTYRPLGAARVGEVLMALGRRWRVGERGLVDLEDALETIDRMAGHVDVPDAARVARRLNTFRMRIARRGGVLP